MPRRVKSKQMLFTTIDYTRENYYAIRSENTQSMILNLDFEFDTFTHPTYYFLKCTTAMKMVAPPTAFPKQCLAIFFCDENKSILFSFSKETMQMDMPTLNYQKEVVSFFSDVDIVLPSTLICNTNSKYFKEFERIAEKDIKIIQLQEKMREKEMSITLYSKQIKKLQDCVKDFLKEDLLP